MENSEHAARTMVIDGSFEDWRRCARALLAAGVPPQAVLWQDARLAPGPALFEAGGVGAEPALQAVRVPPRAIELAKEVALHRSELKWPLLYRVLWRLSHGESELLQIPTDADVQTLERMARAVARDAHKMTAFVRFRKVVTPEGAEHYIAWHRPDHFVVRRTAPFFVDRFRVQKWSILTPDECAHWDGEEICFSPGVPASAAPQGDALEDLWRTYYASIFNPARLKIDMMKREMPVRHWATLPEAREIPELIRQASARTAGMLSRARAATSAADFLPPPGSSLPVLREAARICRGCALYCNATQTVFGEGPVEAALMLVGEQPGDQEDLAGRPFVGPAGEVLEEALRAAGLARDALYVTNAVKHFKFEQRGKKRIHSRPSAREAAACRPWVEAEIAAVKPRVLVCLGATAAQSLLGADFRITRARGRTIVSNLAPHALATWHPSAILRAMDAGSATQMQAELTDDLRLAAQLLRA